MTHRIMIDSMRKLIQIGNRDEWDKLPKGIRATPVYFFKTDTGIELWPMWADHVAYPTIQVSP